MSEDGEDRQRRRRRTPAPLDSAKLDELALAYVSRFATTRAKLRTYLRRKLKERGWAGERSADVDGLAERLTGLGYVDDAAYALSKSRSLSARGYGARRLGQALRAAGVEEQDRAEALDLAGQEAAEAALRFARRRRIGPFATAATDPRQREKALAAMVRAGHDFAVARALVDASPGEQITAEYLVTRHSE